jgi:predicted  nucleic acid-binding Zn-ribbon protein
MKHVLKCQQCGREWNQRGDDIPRQCPGCDSRQWQRIDSLGADSVVTSAVVSDDKAVVTLPVVSPVVGDDKRPMFRDSTAVSGMYQVCVAHGLRYCKPCGTAIGIPASKPMTGATRWCPWCDWRAKKPADGQPSELSQYAAHSAKHNPSAAQWTDAYNVIAVQRKAAGKQPADARH